MGASSEDLHELLRGIRRDCSDIQTRITSAFAILAELNIEDVPHAVCPRCGGKFKGPRTLEEHLHISHPEDAAYPRLK
jgi:hypothetical protein